MGRGPARRDGDFDACGADKSGYANGGTSGARRGEELHIDVVHPLEQIHVGEVDLHGDDVSRGHVGLGEDLADVFQTLANLGLEIGGQFALRIAADLAGGVERAVHEDAGAVGSGRRGAFRGDHPFIEGGGGQGEGGQGGAEQREMSHSGIIPERAAQYFSSTRIRTPYLLPARAAEAKLFSVEDNTVKHSESGERRLSARFPIERDVRFTVHGKRGSSEEGTGTSVNMSSSGVLFTTDRVLLPGRQIEVSLSWPAQLNERCALRFLARGRVVRFEENTAAVQILQHEFRTESPAKRAPIPMDSARK